MIYENFRSVERKQCRRLRRNMPENIEDYVYRPNDFIVPCFAFCQGSRLVAECQIENSDRFSDL